MNDAGRSGIRVFALVALLATLVYVGTVIGLEGAYDTALWRFREVVAVLYVPLWGTWFLLLASLPCGYDWSRTPLMAMGWGLLIVHLVAVPGLIARWGVRALVFLFVIAGNVVLLRVLRDEKLKTAVATAASLRKSRYPDGFGLVAIACLAVMQGSWSALMLIAHDLCDPTGAGCVATRRGLRFAGVVIVAVVIVLCRRTRVPLLVVLALALLVSAAHLPLAMAGLPIGDSTSLAPTVIVGTLASSLALLLSSGSRFGEFWIQLPKYDRFSPAVEKALANSIRHQRKRRHR
jgi:hypothetical protein